jgi:hypothetical protein
VIVKTLVINTHCPSSRERTKTSVEELTSEISSKTAFGTKEDEQDDIVADILKSSIASGEKGTSFAQCRGTVYK